jgi:hypothetical protein
MSKLEQLFPSSTRTLADNIQFVKDAIEKMDIELTDVSELNTPLIRLIKKELGDDYQTTDSKN